MINNDRRCQWCNGTGMTFVIENCDPSWDETVFNYLCDSCAWQAISESERFMAVDSQALIAAIVKRLLRR